MINLPALAQRIGEAELLNKSFFECTKSEIEQICTAVLSSFDSTVPPNGWAVPYIEATPAGPRLVIPYDVHPKYRWWTPEGQGILQTLADIEAPYELVKQHFPVISEDAYQAKLIPF